MSEDRVLHLFKFTLQTCVIYFFLIQVNITNYSGENKKIHKNDLPKTLFKNTYFLNDLESACYGMISMGLLGRLNSYFVDAWTGKEDKIILAEHNCKLFQIN